MELEVPGFGERHRFCCHHTLSLSHCGNPEPKKGSLWNISIVCETLP